MSTTLTTIDEILDAIHAVVLTLPGMKQVPRELPEQINDFPFPIVIPQGEYKWSAKQFITGLHNPVVEIHTARIDMPFDDRRMRGYPNILAKALFNDPTMGAVFNSGAIMGPISYTFSLLTYFSQQTIGWQFTIQNIKSQGVTV